MSTENTKVRIFVFFAADTRRRIGYGVARGRLYIFVTCYWKLGILPGSADGHLCPFSSTVWKHVVRGPSRTGECLEGFLRQKCRMSINQIETCLTDESWVE